jgi:hypothetical protein
MVGLGCSRVVTVPADAQVACEPHALPVLDEHTIACTQAGNVNTGAFDPARNLRAGTAGWSVGSRRRSVRIMGRRLAATRAAA